MLKRYAKRVMVVLMILSLSSFFADARILFQNEYISTQEDNTFTIDAEGDVGSSDLILEFGKLTGTKIVWDITNDQFLFTDDILVQGNTSQTGRNMVLNEGSVGNPDEDVDIIAKQGSEGSGVLRYDDGLNAWTLSNNGVDFNQITTTGSLFSGAGSIGAVPDPIVETGKFLSDDGTWKELLTARDIGFFQINGGTTGTVDVTSVGFQPNFVTISLNNDIEGQNFDSASPGNVNTQQGSFGWGMGYAYDDGMNISQHSQFFSGSSNSINAHRSRSSDTQVMAIVTSNQNGLVTGRLEGTLSAFTANGFTLNITTNTLTEDYVFMYEAQVASGTEIQFISNSTSSETFTIDNDNSGGDIDLIFGDALGQYLRWDQSEGEFVLSNDLSLQGNEIRDVSFEKLASAPVSCNSTNRGKVYYNTTSNDLLSCNGSTWTTLFPSTSSGVSASSTPPVTCNASNAGVQWHDTDVGLTFVCDASNGRNQWLSTSVHSMWGEETEICQNGQDINSSNCTVDWGDDLGPDQNTDLGLYIPYDITVVGYGYSQDNMTCNVGTGSYDVELFSSTGSDDDNNYSNKYDIATGLNGQVNNANNLNIQVPGNRYLLWGIDNNCNQSISDYNIILHYRIRGS